MSTEMCVCTVCASVKQDGFFLAVFVFRVFSYADNEIEVDGFKLAVLFYEYSAVCYLFYNAVEAFPLSKEVITQSLSINLFASSSICLLSPFCFLSIAFFAIILLRFCNTINIITSIMKIGRYVAGFKSPPPLSLLLFSACLTGVRE